MTSTHEVWTERQSAMLEAMGLGLWPSRAAAVESPAVIAQTPMYPLEPAPAIQPVAGANLAQSTFAPDVPTLHAAIQSCRACGLCEGRRQAVPGAGVAGAEWMVVGEAPGEQEDQLGEPFVGASGELLSAMLAAAGRQRDGEKARGQIYITNAVKCRPPGNRNPTGAELAACAPFLQQQLSLVKPKLVLALGRFAAMSLLGSEAPIGKLRASVHRTTNGTPVVVSYHPAYLLRQPLEKARAWEDLCLAIEASARDPVR